jgi:hypothetical protein
MIDDDPNKQWSWNSGEHGSEGAIRIECISGAERGGEVLSSLLDSVAHRPEARR